MTSAPAPIRTIVPVALTEVFAHLSPDFTAETGYSFVVETMLNPEVPAAIAAGSAYDIAFTNPHHAEEVFAAGHGDAASHTALARAPLGFAARGDGDTQVARALPSLRACLQNAGRIGYTETGTSGKSLARLLELLAFDQPLRTELVGLAGGGPMRALRDGDVDLAALPMTNIARQSGVMPVAICPLDLGVEIDLSGFLSLTPRPGAQAFLKWLADHRQEPNWAAFGVERFTLP